MKIMNFKIVCDDCGMHQYTSIEMQEGMITLACEKCDMQVIISAEDFFKKQRTNPNDR